MDLPEIATYVSALIAVIALILALHWVLRRFFGGAERGGQSTARRRDRRLGVVEAAQVGPRHRLLLVRRDNREHLLLIGGATELVIETDIPRASDDADVNIRPVEPRFGSDMRDDGHVESRGYRQADDFEPRAPVARRARTSPGFGAGFAEDSGEDERPASRYDIDERNRDEPSERAARYGSGEDDDDQPDYARSEPAAYPSAERERGFERETSIHERDERSSGDYHLIGEEESQSGTGDEFARRFGRAGPTGERERERDEPEATESRILNRFLKRDGT